MVEFNGNISNECVKYLLKEYYKGASIILFIALLIILPTPLYFAITTGDMVSWIITLIGAICFPSFILFLPLELKLNKSLTTTYVLVEEDLITYKRKEELYKSTDAVKKVIDCGEWYHIIFKFFDRDPWVICQKNLLSKGSIEEFEKLFEGLVVKKQVN